jgi:hypothetical protein
MTPPLEGARNGVRKEDGASARTVRAAQWWGKRKRQRPPRGLWRLILEELAVQSDIESGDSPAIDYRLASAINPPASLSTSLRLPSEIASSGCACDRQPTCVGHPSLGVTSGQFPTSPAAAFSVSTVGSASDLRRNLRPSASSSNQPPTLCRRLHCPAVPSDCPPACAGDPSSVSAFGPALGFRLPLILRLRLGATLRLAPEAASIGSAFQSNLRLILGTYVLRLRLAVCPPTCVGDQRFRLCLPISFRLAPVLLRPASPWERLATCVVRCILRFCQRPIFAFVRSLNPPAVPSICDRLASTANPSAVPANQLSDLRSKIESSGFAIRLSSGLRLRSALRLFR